jgi:hypothetical protein
VIEALPHLKIKSNSIVGYTHFEYSGKHSRSIRSLLQQKSADKFKKNAGDGNTYTGKLRPGTEKRLRKCVDLLVQSVNALPEKRAITPKGGLLEYRLVFITLTIPDKGQVPASHAHKMLLEPMLLWMRRYHNTSMYVWKAELQKRGQLHYHIMCDSYIYFADIQKEWNRLLVKNGFLKEFYSRKKHKNPNSIDARSVKNMEDISHYLAKGIMGEMLKKKQNVKSVKGKVWDCSLNIKAGTMYSALQHGDTANNISLGIRDGSITYTLKDKCCIYKLKKKPTQYLSASDHRDYINHIRGILNYKRKPNPVINSLSHHINDIFPVKKVNFKPQLSLFCTS